MRILSRELEDGFAEAGLKHQEDLVRRLMGSPALVSGLEGKEREVAVGAYVAGIRALFLAAMGLAVVMVFIQAGTGWKGVAKEGEMGEREVDEEVEREESLIVGS